MQNLRGEESTEAAEIPAFAAQYPFPLDSFQREAITHLAHERSVMVAAPTGTGKTLVAEYAMWLAQKRHQRVIYTTPLKALSNQKYRDLREIYGFDAVGLVTGDIVEHSHASIVIMTTEVYRNMLLERGGEGSRDETPTSMPSSLEDVGFVIFDELHYLSDIGRGPIWEEAIICSPPHIQLVGLSATVSNAQDLAHWISRIHRPISLVVHEERAVPLEHYYLFDQKLRLVQDAEGNRVEHFPKIGGEARMAQRMKHHRVYTTRDDEGKPQKSGQSSSQPKKVPGPGEVLMALRDADLLPCLYFLPGRRIVEEAAMAAAAHRFTSPEEEPMIREEVKVWLEHLPAEDRNLQQVQALTNLLPRGLAFHHAGLLPGLKVLVETLFARGHLQAVFATDTLSLGINMPARSVVVGSLSKFDGQEMRLLTPNEYRQLTGRAGRRGMDVRGAAIIPYSPWEPFESAFQRITGELLPVTSAFVIRYNSILNLWHQGDTQYLRHVCASSLREFQRYLQWERNELHRLKKSGTRHRKSKQGSKKSINAAQSAAAAFEKQRQQISAHPLSRAGAAELDGTIFALRALGYIAQDNRLTRKGRLLRTIFHPAGVLIIELMMRGVLDELTAGELAEVCSWFTYDSERRLNNHHVLSSQLKQVRRELWRIEEHIHDVEERAGLNFTSGIVVDFHGVVLSWSRKMSLSGLLQHIDLAEGDLLMVLNQTIDLLQQVQAAMGQLLDRRDTWVMRTEGVAGEHNAAPAKQRARQAPVDYERLTRLRLLLGQASASLRHGIVAQSRAAPSMVASVDTEEVPLDTEDAAGVVEGQQPLL